MPAPDRAQAARQRREDDLRLAALLVEGGILEQEIYRCPDDPDVEDYYVAKDYSDLTESLGRPLATWDGFSVTAYRKKVAQGLRYAQFCSEHDIREVRQVRVATPVCSIPIAAIRQHHARFSDQINSRLRYGLRHHAPDVEVDLIAVHIHRDGPGRAYMHAHLTCRGGTAEQWAALQAYWIGGNGLLENGWQWWAAHDDERLQRHPTALVQYSSAGLAEDLDDTWTPGELAELWRQTRGLSLVRAKGEYRRWVGLLNQEGMEVRRCETGKLEKVPRSHSKPRRLEHLRFKNIGYRVLRTTMHDFGDGVQRECWHIRGQQGITAANIRQAYTDAFTACAANPESLTGRRGEPAIPETERKPSRLVTQRRHGRVLGRRMLDQSPVAWRSRLPLGPQSDGWSRCHHSTLPAASATFRKIRDLSEDARSDRLITGLTPPQSKA